MDNNPAEGISVANQSLVLQNVSRSHAGIYTCVGSNREGDGESNPVQLDISCKSAFSSSTVCRINYSSKPSSTPTQSLAPFVVAPVCRPGQRDVYSVGRGEAVRVVCEMEANPSNVNFTWKFNGTNAENVDIPTSEILTESHKSVATYKPNSENVSEPKPVFP